MGRPRAKKLSVRERERRAKALAQGWTGEAFEQARKRLEAEQLVAALRREVLILLTVALAELGALILVLR